MHGVEVFWSVLDVDDDNPHPHHHPQPRSILATPFSQNASIFFVVPQHDGSQPSQTVLVKSKDMEDQRRIFDLFLRASAHKCRPSKQPHAYLQFYRGAIPHAQPLIRFTEEDVMRELDTDNSDLARWLLHQMRTHDNERQKVIGLIFDRTTVVSDVLEDPRDRR